MKHVAEDADQAAPLESQVLKPSSRAFSICAWLLTLSLWTRSQNRLRYAHLTLLGESDTAQATLSKPIGNQDAYAEHLNDQCRHSIEEMALYRGRRADPIEMVQT